MNQIYQDNLTLCSSFLSNKKLKLAARLLPGLNCAPLISIEIPFHQAEYAYRLEKEKKHIKIAIRVSS
jgi:hypothetical protein